MSLFYDIKDELIACEAELKKRTETAERLDALADRWRERAEQAERRLEDTKTLRANEQAFADRMIEEKRALSRALEAAAELLRWIGEEYPAALEAAPTDLFHGYRRAVALADSGEGRKLWDHTPDNSPPIPVGGLSETPAPKVVARGTARLKPVCPTCGSDDPAKPRPCECPSCRRIPGEELGCPDPFHSEGEPPLGYDSALGPNPLAESECRGPGCTRCGYTGLIDGKPCSACADSEGEK